MEKKLKIKDYIALYKMSMRNYFWSIDSRQALNKMKGVSIPVWFISVIIGYGLPIMFIWGIIGFVQALLLTPLRWISPTLGMVAAMQPGAHIGIIFMSAFLFLICSPMVFNKDRLRYNMNFKKSTWWHNTGISPSEIIKDQGLYGEYIATMVALQNMEKYKLYGKVFNNVVVPKDDGDFTELDVVCVNETGIHVIEAKARGGRLQGNLTDPKWKQFMGHQEHNMDNPLYQNVGHINFLTEYLFKHLPDGSARTKAAFPYSYVNVGLLCLAECDTSGLSDVPAPSQFFLGPAEGSKGYQNLDVRKMYTVRFSRKEVDQICAALEAISTHTHEEVHRLVQQRQLAYDRNEYRYQTAYSLVRLESVTADGDIEVNDLICKEHGGYRTYLDTSDNLFKAIPNSRIIGQSKKTQDLNELLTYYAQMRGVR